MSEAEKRRRMTDVRCVKCNKLLMKADMVTAEVKCPKCGYLNKLTVLRINKGSSSIEGEIEAVIDVE